MSNLSIKSRMQVIVRHVHLIQKLLEMTIEELIIRENEEKGKSP